jgi:DNA modification methylase
MKTVRKIITADSLEWVKNVPSNFYDHIITDPVYGEPFDILTWRRVCKGNILVFCRPESQPFVPDEFLFWVKTPSTKNYLRNCGRFVEMILVSRAGSTFNQLHWSQMTGMYDDRVVEKVGHPWRKPMSLIERLVRIYTNEGDRVLDPFCGSGTTLLACHTLNRSCTGVEKDPVWGNYSE